MPPAYRAGIQTAFAFVAFATVLQGNPSLGGPPGRSDFFKWRDFRSRSAQQGAQKKESAAPKPNAPASDSSPPTATEAPASAPPPTPATQSSAPSAPNPPAVASADPAESPPPAAAPAAEKTAVSAPAALSKAQYDQVLTDRQKAILRERAEANSLDPQDYEHLLSDDEKERLNPLVEEHRRQVTTGN